MTRHLPRPLRVLLFSLLAVPPWAAASEKAERRDVDLPIGVPLSLRDFGGPDVEITVHSASATNVTFSVTDYSSLRRVARSDRFGNFAGTALVPRSFRRSLRLRLGEARALPGPFSKGYLLYRAGGLWVYYDTKIPPMNRVYLAITKHPLPREN